MEGIAKSREGAPYVPREAYQGRASEAVDALVLERLERRCNELDGEMKRLRETVARLEGVLRRYYGWIDTARDIHSEAPVL